GTGAGGFAGGGPAGIPGSGGRLASRPVYSFAASAGEGADKDEGDQRGVCLPEDLSARTELQAIASAQHDTASSHFRTPFSGTLCIALPATGRDPLHPGPFWDGEQRRLLSGWALPCLRKLR